MSDTFRKDHIVSIVLNGVLGDSRVLKTARAAERAGFRATIVGTSNVEEVTRTSIEDVDVVLVPSPVAELKRRGAWPQDKNQRQLWMLVERTLEQMLPVIRDLQPSLIHSHDMLGLRVGAAASHLVAALGHPVPWIHDLHEYVVGLTTVPETYRIAAIEYERRYLRKADHLITVSDQLAKEVARIYKLRQPPTVIYNAPAIQPASDLPDIRTTLDLPAGVPLVAYIGVAKRERGCETIVEAVSRLPGVHICFVSDSAYVGQLEQLAVELGMGGRFHRLPYVASDMVSTFVRTADVGTHGLIHYPNGEVAMPNKMFEYLHAGIPMVVSDVAEMKRFVNENRIGQVFEAENPVSCAWAIHNVLRHKSHYADNITEELKRKYSWDTQADELAKIYNTLISRNVEGDRKVLVLGDGSRDLDALKGEFGSFDSALHVGVMSPEAPEFCCDFYADNSVRTDRAGMLSNFVRRYHTILCQNGCLDAAEVTALKSAGVTVKLFSWGEEGEILFQRRAAEVVRPLLAIEKERLLSDHGHQQLEVEKGFAATAGAIDNPAMAFELKVAKKRITKLTAVIREQKLLLRKLQQLEKA